MSLPVTASITAIAGNRQECRGLVDLEGSSTQLWAFFLFTRACNNRCSQGEVIKKQSESISTPPLSPLPILSLEKRQPLTVCVSPGVIVGSQGKWIMEENKKKRNTDNFWGQTVPFKLLKTNNKTSFLRK